MSEYALGNIYVRDNGSPHVKGWIMPGHCHLFSHVTYVLQGRYRAKRWTRIAETGPYRDQWQLTADIEIGPGHPLLITADDKHSFECIEGPGILHCLYSHREPQTGEVVQEMNGWNDAYRCRPGSVWN